MEIRVRCEGIFALLLNPATAELAEQLITGVRTPISPDTTPEKQAEKKLLKDEDGRIGIPMEYLFASLRDAGRWVKFAGRSNISTKTETRLPGFLDIKEKFLPFPEGTEWKTDIKIGKPAPNVPTMPIIRPRFDEWGFEANLIIDETQVSEKTVKQLFEIAGKRVGIGAFRPTRGGPYGRFKIIEWEVLGDEDDTTDQQDQGVA